MTWCVKSIYRTYLSILPKIKDFAKKKNITMVKSFARSCGMAMLIFATP
jgi:hypothetical protein